MADHPFPLHSFSPEARANRQKMLEALKWVLSDRPSFLQMHLGGMIRSFAVSNYFNNFIVRFSQTQPNSRWRRTGELICIIPLGPRRNSPEKYVRVGRVNVDYEWPAGVTEISVTHLAAEDRRAI